ncbi:response regulator [Tolypothrix sp. FACHB-123]|nr:response regulator [Tolypothrix sp. FACHB-123]
MKQSVLPLTRSLLPYINKGITELVEVPDLPFPEAKAQAAVVETKEEISVAKFDKLFSRGISTFPESSKQGNNYSANLLTLNNKSTFPQPTTSHSPLIACIDDSLQICKMMEKILTDNGLKFIGISEPVQALPILIQKKPDLIFLDLIMPVVSGYEIYAQLRRSSFLSKIPVVILTGSDRLLEPVHSKGFGATEFMTKPVLPTKVLEIVDKLTGTKTASTFHQKSKLAVC